MTTRPDHLCPCGSGKLRRHCCDAAEHPARRIPDAELPLRDEREREVLLAGFMAAPLSERDSMARHAIHEDSTLDAELAFEMIAVIRDDDRAIFAELAEILYTRRPALFAAHAIYYLDWLIEDALLAADIDTLPTLCAQVADASTQDVELFTITIDRLAYFGRLELLAPLMARAVPQIHAADLPDWQVDAFADRAADLMLCAVWQQKPTLDASDPHLLALLAPFGDAPAARLTRCVDYLNGTTAPQWHGIAVPHMRQQATPTTLEALLQALDTLSFAFVGDSWRTERIPLAKASLIRTTMLDYLVARHNGSLRRITAHPKRVRRVASHRPTPIPMLHPLCPDRMSLEAFLATLLDLPSPHYYTAAALLELTPAWLRFLARQGIITHTQHTEAIQHLYPIAVESAEIWGENSAGISVAPNIRLAWEEALPRSGPL